MEIISDIVSTALTAILAAILALAVAAIGYFRNRRITQVGVAMALQTEIGEKMKASEESLFEGWHKKVAQLIEDDAKPLITMDSEVNGLFHTYRGELHFLPQRVIRDIIHFYSIDRFLSSGLQKMGMDEFMQIGRERRLQHLSNLQRVHEQKYLTAGSKVCEVLTRYVEARKSSSVLGDIWNPDRWVDWENKDR